MVHIDDLYIKMFRSQSNRLYSPVCPSSDILLSRAQHSKLHQSFFHPCYEAAQHDQTLAPGGRPNRNSEDTQGYFAEL